MKKRTPKNSTKNSAKKIFSLAKRVVSDPDSPDREKLEENLSNCIYECLVTKNDSPIFEAMELANIDCDQEAFEEIVKSTEDESTCADLTDVVASPVKVSHLFVIPVVIELPFSGFSATFEDGPAVRALEQSIMNARLSDGNQRVRIVNYLYSETELHNSVPSDIFRMTKEIPLMKPGSFSEKEWNFLQWNAATDTVESIQQSTAPKAARIDSNVVLRYLVGSFSNDDFVDPFETAYDSEEDSDELRIYAERMSLWQDNAIELINSCLGNQFTERKLTVGALDTFNLGIRLGQEDYKQSILILQMHESLNSKDINPKATRALVAPFGSGHCSEIRVAIISLLTSDFCTGLVYTLDEGEDYDSAMETLAHQLLSNGVFSIDMISELQDPDSTKFRETGFLLTHPEVRNSYDIIDENSSKVLH